ncbi:uncharacterized protein BDV14DRAFT_201542 [Aspergillus stella-maris]|uniref:uncharacterized protein n=1 Tax=Aspergillus stella-maris TaxID=1810926 RepID=UPI003CCD65D8
MGHKLSAVTGVRSENFTEPGNAINEIWIGNTEIISRLPFGDNDLEQAGWPAGRMPKIPWHNFIIPLKRDIQVHNNETHRFVLRSASETPIDRFLCCIDHVCTADLTTHRITTRLTNALLVILFLVALESTWFAIIHLEEPKTLRETGIVYDSFLMKTRKYLNNFAFCALIGTWVYTSGIFFAYFALLCWAQLFYALDLVSWAWQLLWVPMGCFYVYWATLGARALGLIWRDFWRYRRRVRSDEKADEAERVEANAGLEGNK